MHSIRLNIQDSVLDKVLYFLQNLPKNEVMIIEDIVTNTQNMIDNDSADIKAFSSHSANLIEEWQDEDDIWK